MFVLYISNATTDIYNWYISICITISESELLKKVNYVKNICNKDFNIWKIISWMFLETIGWKTFHLKFPSQ